MHMRPFCDHHPTRYNRQQKTIHVQIGFAGVPQRPVVVEKGHEHEGHEHAGLARQDDEAARGHLPGVAVDHEQDGGGKRAGAAGQHRHDELAGVERAAGSNACGR